MALIVLPAVGILLMLISSHAVAAQKAPAQAAGKMGVRYEYKRVGGKPLYLYVQSPPEAFAGDRPAAVFFHGGGWTSGSVDLFERQGAYLASRGMVGVQVDYRLLHKGGSDPLEICAEDSKSAMRWVRSHAKMLHLQPDKIAAVGSSAGGYLAAAVTMLPGVNDPGDDLSVSSKGNAMLLIMPVLDNSPEGDGTADGGKNKKYVPINFVDASTPPTIIMSGADDPIAQPETLRRFQKLVQDSGGRCDLIFYPGQRHGFFRNEPYTSLTMKEMAHFLESLGYLQPSSAPVRLPPLDGPDPPAM
jgi:acetyl esterase/lipase